ncbi:hypothetical protein [Yoonia sp. 2307UL14-13]|uniref:hypothetical protein n=1 Tax=Yoonia sp. 2307UL14-13 TaxID=3126506 RepID=UPI00309602A0
MTLVYASIGQSSATIISDIMLSRNRPRTDGKPLWLVAEDNVQEHGYATVGHTQKTVMFNRRCLYLWAGNMLIARSIYKFLRAHFSKSFTEIEQLLEQEYSKDQLDRVDYAIVRFRNGQTEFFGSGGIHTDLGGVVTWEAGSGGYFVDPAHHLAEQTTGPTEDGDILNAEATDLLIRLYHGEAGAYEYHSFRSGGWYEVTVLRDGLFHKVPYAVCYYDLDEVEKSSTYEPTMAIFARYMTDTLLVNRAWGGKASLIISCVDSFKTQTVRNITEPDRYFLSGLNKWPLLFQHTFRQGGKSIMTLVSQDDQLSEDMQILDLSSPRFLVSDDTRDFIDEQLLIEAEA